MAKRNSLLQPIRISTLKHQLKALACQVDAINRLDCEHQDGIDLGADPECVNVLYFSQRLASRAETIVKKADADDFDGVTSLLDKMRDDVTYLCAHASSFQKHAELRAGDHLNEILQTNEQTSNSGSSLVQAGLSCFKAEANQSRTFELQVLALVYLALEVAYFAAIEVDAKPMMLPAIATTGLAVQGST